MAILELKEAGDLASLRNKWWLEKSDCRSDTRQVKKIDEQTKSL